MPEGSDDDNHGGSTLISYARLAHRAPWVAGGRLPGLERRLAYKHPFTRDPVPSDDVYYCEVDADVGRYKRPYVSPSVRHRLHMNQCC